MYEHYRQPLIPRSQFILRLIVYVSIVLGIIIISLTIGIIGYHIFEGLSWIDSTANVAMIFGGMGPMNTLHTDAGKLFPSAYALFSGIVFLGAIVVLIAPIVHRFLHRFHLESDTEIPT